MKTIILSLLSFLFFGYTNGQVDFGEQQSFSISFDSVWNAFFYDMDGDNDIDILYGGNRIGWIENTDGNGNFSEFHHVAYTWETYVSAGDIDNDGDLDILEASLLGPGGLGWYENNGQGDFVLQQLIWVNTEYFGVNFVNHSDIDGDGDQDVIYSLTCLAPYCESHEIGWFENSDGQGSFPYNNNFISYVIDFGSTYAADIDGDDDDDVVSEGLNGIFWYENTDGQGNFGTGQIISTTESLAYIKDLDGDGDIDVLSKSSNGKISWHENTDGQGDFGIQHIISYDFYPYAVFAVDIDLDGDIDVLSTSKSKDKIGYFENLDGQGSFGTLHTIDDDINDPMSVHANDIDGDSDMDILVSSRTMDSIVWYENLSPLGVNENALTNFSIYPNPTNGILNIQSQKNTVQIDVINSLGQLVLTNTEKSSIDMATLAKGLYILKIIDENGNLGFKKILKE